MDREEYRSMAKIIAVRGESLPHTKLDDQAVREIRENRSGLFAWQLAEKYGVHVRTIEKVRHYETWTHVM